MINDNKVALPISTIENTIAKPKAFVIFAHGAGADKSHEFMENVSMAFQGDRRNVINLTKQQKHISKETLEMQQKNTQWKSSFRALICTRNEIVIVI